MRYAPAILLLGLLAACTAPPVQEMSDARQAVRAAQAAGAADRAPIELAEAQQLIDEAQLYLSRKDYRRAERAAVEARSAAIRALNAAREIRDGSS